MPSRRVIDTAVVEIVPSFPGFEQTVQREVDQALDDVVDSSRSATAMMERQFRDLELDIEQVFNDIFREGSIDLDRLVGVAARTAAATSGDFERAGEIAEAAFTEFRRSAELDMDRVAAHAAVTSKASAKSFSGGALAATAALGGIAIAGVAGLGAIATMGLSSAASLEQTQISFNALLGSAEKGQEVFRSLQKFAAVTPFEFPEVASAAKRFLAFNEAVNLTDDDLQGFLTTVGDLSSVTGAGAEGLNRITLAIGQISSKGKTSLEELMQIGEAVPGFSAVGAIAKSLGITTGEAMAKISAGEVDAVTGVHALLEGMKQFPGAAGAMEKQSQTLLGVFSTFKDTVGQALADSFAPAIPAIKDALTELTPILGESLRSLAPAIGELLTGLLKLVGPLIQTIEPIITPILKALGPALTQLGPALIPLGVALGQIVTSLLPLIPLLVELLVLTVKLATPFVQLLVPAFQLLAPAINALIAPFAELNKLIDQTDWGKVGKQISQGFLKAAEAVGEFFTDIGDFFKALPGQIGEFLLDLPGVILDIFVFALKIVLQAVGVGLGLIIALFLNFPKLAVGALFVLFVMLPQLFSQMWDSIAHLTATAFVAFITFLATLPAKTFDVLVDLVHIIPNIFSTAFHAAVDVVGDAIGSMIDFVGSIPDKIGGFAKRIGVGIVNFFVDSLNGVINQLNEGIGKVDEFIPGDLPRIPHIPRLAHGGIAFGPAMIGEDAGTTPEAALPLGDARAMSMLREALGTGGTTFEPGAVVINVNVTGDVSAEKAKTIGENIGAGLQSVMQGRDITTAVRVA